jgi:prepilin-type N-terminal cleavage/methylation domain-containing protein
MRLSNTLMMNETLLPTGKKAFTLAEVLITLSILGVVAALTIPSLVNRQSDLAAQVKLKKAISNYEDVAAVYMVENEAGTFDIAKPATGSNADCTKLANYFKIVEGPTAANSNAGCEFTTADGAAWYINKDGYATVTDAKASPRYAVTMWTVNGQVNGLGKTDGVTNIPSALETYKPYGAALVPSSRTMAPANLFLNGTYECGSGKAPTLDTTNDDVKCS